MVADARSDKEKAALNFLLKKKNTNSKLDPEIG